MNARYLRQRQLLAAHEGDTVDITSFGDPGPRFLDKSPTRDDYTRLARDAYLRGDLTVEAFESVLDAELGLRRRDGGTS